MRRGADRGCVVPGCRAACSCARWRDPGRRGIPDRTGQPERARGIRSEPRGAPPRFRGGVARYPPRSAGDLCAARRRKRPARVRRVPPDGWRRPFVRAEHRRSRSGHLRRPYRGVVPGGGGRFGVTRESRRVDSRGYAALDENVVRSSARRAGGGGCRDWRSDAVRLDRGDAPRSGGRPCREGRTGQPGGGYRTQAPGRHPGATAQSRR